MYLHWYCPSHSSAASCVVKSPNESPKEFNYSSKKFSKVGQNNQEQWYTNNGVDDRSHSTICCFGSNVTVT